ncbi:MAG: hypothetical protein IH951_05100 [Bacteroidetes bacterium]|nr:hypothetical protein [Bacteroidota bacterium]
MTYLRPDRPDLPELRPDDRDEPLDLPDDLETPEDLEPPDDLRTPEDLEPADDLCAPETLEPLDDLLGPARRMLPDDREPGAVRLTAGTRLDVDPCERILALGEFVLVLVTTPDLLVDLLERVNGPLRDLLDDRSTDEVLELEPGRRALLRELERDSASRKLLPKEVLR